MWPLSTTRASLQLGDHDGIKLVAEVTPGLNSANIDDGTLTLTQGDAGMYAALTLTVRGNQGGDVDTDITATFAIP